VTKQLLRDLEQISNDLLRLTAAAEDAVGQAITAVLSRDLELARAVVLGDERIDRMEVQLEEDCLKVLALHQPVAGDLRFVISAIKITSDLERIGDLAKNTAKRAIEIGDGPPIEPPEDFEQMADNVRAMIRNAIHSLVRSDSHLARKVLTRDDEVDSQYRVMLKELQRRMIAGEDDELDPLLRWQGVLRCMERVADLATNIAEDVIYLVEGEIIRHQGN
jgi:phosphate transport system protein